MDPYEFQQILHALSRYNYPLDEKYVEFTILRILKNPEKVNYPTGDWVRMALSCIELHKSLSVTTINLIVK